MSSPASLSEYIARFNTNFSVTWGGPGDTVATVHLPCPWCAAADFATYTVPTGQDAARSAVAALRDTHTCTDCHRGGTYLVHHVDDHGDRMSFKVVQTIGADPPAWLADTPLINGM